MSETIHPTAIVDPKAQLGAGVSIGAFCVIGPDVILGPDVKLGHHVVLEGRVELAARVLVGHGTCIGGNPQHLKFKPETRSGVRIGAETVLRECVIIHRATQPEGWTEIGPKCLIMATSHIAHDCQIGAENVIVNYAAIGGHCEFGDNVFFGGHVGCPQFTRLGTFAYIGGVSKIEGDVPPYTIANGVPAVAVGVNVIGLRRAGMPAAERRTLQEAFRLVYRSGLAPARAVERIRAEIPATPSVQRFVDFIGSSRRGIIKPRGGWSGAGADVSDAVEREPIA